MVCNKLTDAWGYAVSPLRIEYRPTYGLDTKDTLLRYLDMLTKAKINAWWYSVALKGSYPAFKSRHMPYVESAVEPEYFQWLADEAHQRGIALMTWEYLATAPLVTDRNPEWRWKMFDWDGPHTVRDGHYACWNSPYGELLMKYCAEIVVDLRFDGIWFDGSFMHGHDMTGEYACCCEFCKAKYHKETGKEIPSTVNFNDPECRDYFVWRGNDHYKYWAKLSSYVKSQKAEAIVAYNFFNRLGRGIDCGTPMIKADDDSSMLATEVGHCLLQTPMLAKTMRAVNNNYPPELWTYVQDSNKAQNTVLDTVPLLYHIQRCVSAGSFPSFGIGTRNFLDYADTLTELSEHANKLAPYIDGEPLAPVAILYSGASKDMGYFTPDGKDYDLTVVSNAAFGLHGMLDAMHIQSEIILDNVTSQETLAQYRIIFLPNVKCISDEMVEALEGYVANGGVIIVTGETGTMDDSGHARNGSALDNLLGIETIDPAAIHTFCFKLGDELSGLTDITRAISLPGKSCHIKAVKAEVLASGSYSIIGKKVYGPDGLIKPKEDNFVHGDVITRNRIGKGYAIYFGVNVDYEYAHSGPHKLSRNIFGSVINEFLDRDVIIDAPINVAVNLYRQGDRLVVHLLDTPDTMVYLGLDYPEVKVPKLRPENFGWSGPVAITFDKKYINVHSPTGTGYELVMDDNGKTVLKVDLFKQYAMIVLS